MSQVLDETSVLLRGRRARALRTAPVRAALFDGGNTILELDYPWLSGLAGSLGTLATAEDIGMAGARLLRHNSLRYGKTPAPADAGAVLRSSFQAIGEAVGLAADAAREFARAVEREDQRDPRGLWRCPSRGAARTLAALRERGLRLGVISNSDGHVEKHLVLAGLRDWFDIVIDSSVVGVEKPDPRIFGLALQQLQIPAGDAIYVGDLLDIDVVGARGAGLEALLYDRFDAYPDVTEGRIRALSQVLDRTAEPHV